MAYNFHYFKGQNLNRVIKVQKKVIEILKNIECGDESVDVCKDWVSAHFLTASQMAHLLALKRRQNWELAVTAGILHDIGLIVNMGMNKDHAFNGYDKAKEILNEVGGYSAEEIEFIAKAISSHSEKDKVGSWLDELIKDVDVLDCTLHGSDFSDHQHHYQRVKNLEKELNIKIT